MRVVGLAGWSGSGKTTLVSKLIPCLVERGIRVSTLKHAHAGFDIDVPGKDSHTHRLSGATEVLISSPRRFALVHELRNETEFSLPALLRKLEPVDLVIVEGFKRYGHPKLEVFRAEVGKEYIHPTDPQVFAIASDNELRNLSLSLPFVGLNDVEAIADLMLANAMPIAQAISSLRTQTAG